MQQVNILSTLKRYHDTTWRQAQELSPSLVKISIWEIICKFWFLYFWEFACITWLLYFLPEWLTIRNMLLTIENFDHVEILWGTVQNPSPLYLSFPTFLNSLILPTYLFFTSFFLFSSFPFSLFHSLFYLSLVGIILASCSVETCELFDLLCCPTPRYSLSVNRE